MPLFPVGHSHVTALITGFTGFPSRYVVIPRRGEAQNAREGFAIPAPDDDDAAELRRQLEEARAERDAVTRALAAALGGDEDTAKRDAMIGRIVRHLRVIKGGGVILGVLGAVEWLWRHPREVLAAAAATNAALGTGALILMPHESERRPGAAPTTMPVPAVTATSRPTPGPGRTAVPVATAPPTPTVAAEPSPAMTSPPAGGDGPLPAPTRSGPVTRPPPTMPPGGGPAPFPAPQPEPSPAPKADDCITLEVPQADVDKKVCPPGQLVS